MADKKRPYGIADLDYQTQQRIEAMKGQLLIALVNRLGGSLEMPVEEVDGTGAFVLFMGQDEEAKTFSFRVERKER